MDGSFTADQVEQAAQSPGDSPAHTREVDPLTVTRRLQREGRWKDIEPERNEMIKLAKKQFPDKSERQQWVYSELDRLYPPLPETREMPQASKGLYHEKSSHGLLPRRPDAESTDDGQIQGLATIPGDWPELPANSSLSSEVGWVQASRLRVVEERPGRATLVHLERALSPAPSWSAVGWLETSIRSYAKFVDVAAKATSVDDGEHGVMRRERMAIGEVEALLDEMREAKGSGPRPA